MGPCGSSLSKEEKEAIQRSKKLEAQNAADYEHEANKIKLLLLGAGESGKSTVFKQMKLLYGKGFSHEERLSWLPKIQMNLIAAMKAICNAVVTLGLEDQVENKNPFQCLCEISSRAELSDELAESIKILWTDPAIQKAWERRSEYQVIESNELYFRKIDALKEFGYVPSDEDILASRVRTCGIVESSYEIEDVTFVIIDVGGQRNERKKWIHAFADVNAVIFVAALSEFDQKMFEDETQNRMTDTLHLFDEICNSRWFQKTAMILFLNKFDLFENKVKKVGIAQVDEFNDYRGKPNDFKEGVKYFLGKFLALNRQPNKDIYHHVTCATDTQNVEHVFTASKDIILKINLEMSGFM